MFAEWLARTYDLQTTAFLIDPTALEGEAFAEYVRDQVLSTTVELGEFLQELPWKPHNRATNGRPDAEHRVRAIGEAVDAMHHLANCLVALRVTDDELTTAYLTKQQVNRERQLAQRRAEAT
jgi:hypothetical protein